MSVFEKMGVIEPPKQSPIILDDSIARFITNSLDKLIESKDRVDISLKEYEELKSINAQFARENGELMSILNKMGLDKRMVGRVIPGTIKVHTCDSSVTFLEEKEKVRIEFEVYRCAD